MNKYLDLLAKTVRAALFCCENDQNKTKKTKEKYFHLLDTLTIGRLIAGENISPDLEGALFLHDIGAIASFTKADHAQKGYDLLKEEGISSAELLLPIRYHEDGELTGISAKGNFCFNDTSLNKRNTSDFAIWKFDKDDSRGYPGWDIQCAANCIIHLNNSLDYIIVGFNELVHTENINTLINLYPRKVTNTKWIRIHYVDFQDDVPLFYLKDFIDKGFSRQPRYLGKYG